MEFSEAKNEWGSRFLETSATCHYQISAEHLKALVQIFGDVNPLHTDREYARSHDFADAVMHGAILTSFLSHFVGMVLPGSGAVILAQEIRFLKPCFLKHSMQGLWPIQPIRI